jgi:hypothetical protein
MRKGPGSVYDKWNIWIRGHYPRVLFRLDMGLVFHPAHKKERCGIKKKRKIMLTILFF